MNTFEITIQHRTGATWPVVAEWFASGGLPVRHEDALQLAPDALRGLGTEEYGRALGLALFQTPIRTAFDQALGASGGDLHVLLCVEAPDLQVLHWERVCRPVPGDWTPLARDPQLPFALYHPAVTDRRFPAISRHDLRALLVVANPPDLTRYRLAPVDAEAAVRAILPGLDALPDEGDGRPALRGVPYGVLGPVRGATGPATLDALCAALTERPYTLLHVVAHGGRSDTNGEQALFLESPRDGRTAPVGASDLIERLRKVRGARGLPHLVFLSCCESADPAAGDTAGTLSRRLVRDLGIPAVVGMTDRISVTTALALAAPFYRQLRRHGEPDRALVESFAGLADRPDIGFPVLGTRLGGRPLFSLAPDGPLTDGQLVNGLERLESLLPERAPVLLDEFRAHAAALRRTSTVEPTQLTRDEREAHDRALAAVDALCAEVVGISFRALADDQPVPGYDRRCPFRGLEAFDPARPKNPNDPSDDPELDAKAFFGRSAWIARLSSRLKAHNFLAVLGASGSGKSSLVLAGLVPRLRADRPGLELIRLTPGRDPLAALQPALAAAGAGRPDVVVVVDQFEEAFTLAPGADRAAFFDGVLKVAGTCRVVITMRADFWGDCATYPALRDAIRDHQELIGPLSPEELREAMTGQAEQVGLRFEPGLVGAILDDVAGEPGAMPLLQHALRELWMHRHGRRLRADEYQRLGRVKGAIARTADAVVDQLEREGLGDRVRDVFLRLTRVDEAPSGAQRDPPMDEGARTEGVRRDTRRRVRITALGPTGDASEQVRGLVNRLADARLVITTPGAGDGPTEVEVAHEALIRHWPRLARWLNDDRDALRLRQDIGESAAEWLRARRDRSFLVHRGQRLRDAEVLRGSKRLPLNDDESAYLDACGRRARWDLAIRLAVAVIGAGLLALLVAVQAKRLDDQWEADKIRAIDRDKAAKEANRVAARMAWDRAQALGEQEKPWRSLLWLARGLDHAVKAQDAELEDALRTELTGWRPAVHRLEGVVEDEAFEIALGPDGRTLFVADVLARTGRLWDVESGTRIGPDLPHPGGVAFSAFSPDGKTLLTRTVANDGLGFPVSTPGGDTAFLWNATTGLPIAQLRHEEVIGRSVYDPKGQFIATAGATKTARLWSAQTGALLRTLPHDGPVTALAFSPDGKWLATGNQGGIRVWRTDDGSLAVGPVTVPGGAPASGNERGVGALAFSPDGKALLSGGGRTSATATAYLWTFTPEPARLALARAYVHRMRGDTYPMVTGVAFGPDSESVLVYIRDSQGSVRRWDGPQEFGEPAPIDADRFVLSPDRRTLAGTNGLWDVVTGRRLGPLPHTSPFGSRLAFGGERVAVAGTDRAVRVYETRPLGEPVVRRPNGPNMPVGVALAPDGRTAVTCYFNQRVPEGARGYECRAWNLEHDRALGPAVALPKSNAAFTNLGSALQYRPGEAVFLLDTSFGVSRLWDLKTGQPIPADLPEGNSSVARFAPDGKTFLFLTDTGTARLWGIDGRPVGSEFTIGTDPTSRFPLSFHSFHPSGKAVLVGRADRRVQCLDPVTGRASPLGPPDGSPLAKQPGILRAEFLAGGSAILTEIDLSRGQRQTGLRVWKADTGQQIGVEIPVPSASSVGCGPRSTVVGLFDHASALFFRLEPERIAPLDIKVPGPVRLFALDPLDRYLVIAAGNRVLWWDLSVGRWRDGVKPVECPADPDRLAFRPDGQVLAVAMKNGRVEFWDVAAPPNAALPAIDLGPDAGPIGRVQFAADGKTVVLGDLGGNPRVWDSTKKAFVDAPLVSPSEIWDMTAGRSRPHVNILDVSPEGPVAVGHYQVSRVTAWNPVTGQPVGRTCPNDPTIAAVGYSPATRRVLVREIDGAVRLYDLDTNRPTGRALAPLETRPAMFGQGRAVFSPDGRRLLTFGEGGRPQLWDGSTGAPIGPPLNAAVGAVASFGADGRVLTVGADRLIRVWSADGQLTREVAGPAGMQEVLLAPGGRFLLALGREAGGTWLWDLTPQTGAPTPIDVSGFGLFGGAFRGDGLQLLGGSGNDTAKLWDLRTGRTVGAPFRLPGQLQASAFVDQDRAVLLATSDGSFLRWPLPVPLAGEVDAVALWAEVLTGERIDENGVVRPLSAAQWRERRQELRALQARGGIGLP